MKRDKLYTANKWNKPLFEGGFNGVYGSYGNPGNNGMNVFAGGGLSALAQADFQNNPWNYTQDYMFGNGPSIEQQYANSKNKLGISKADNPFSKMNIGGTALGLAGAAGGMAGGLISNGYSSGAGKAFDAIGNVAGAIPGPWGAVASAGAKILGGLANAAFGTKVDQEKLNAANAGTSYLSGFRSNASSYDDVQGPANVGTFQDPYKGGWFAKGKARRKNEALQNQRIQAQSWADRSVDNNLMNIGDDQMNTLLANYSSFGGQLGNGQWTMDNDMGAAINYGFMNDWLNTKKKKVENGDKMGNVRDMGTIGNIFADGGGIHIKKANEGKFTAQAKRAGMGVQEYASHVLANKEDYPTSTVRRANFARNASKWHGLGGPLIDGSYDGLFALGGDLGMHGSDFSTGLVHIDEGGTHSENPYGGVQLGTDSQGTPNMVEEGETVYNEYVYSNRINADEETKKMFHLPKKKDITYAEISKRLEKEAAERPNDPISAAALKVQMQDLADQQERQKAEMEAEEARAAFEALSPEEQVAVMEQMQQPVVAENPNGNDGIDGSYEMNEMNEVPMQEQQEQMPVEGMAEGGKINKFDKGGKKNSGKWKNDKENHWDIYTRPGLEAFLKEAEDRLNKEGLSDEEKNNIRKDIMNKFNSLQQSYANVYPGNLGSMYPYNEDVLKHQQLFNSLYGNTGFYSTDENGNVTNIIASGIDRPNGAATQDIPGEWADGYWGPRTSIRNFGSTEYGDPEYYSDITKRFSDLGLTYAPNSNWTYGDNGSQLYGLSMPEVSNGQSTRSDGSDGVTGTNGINENNGNGDAITRVGVMPDSLKSPDLGVADSDRLTSVELEPIHKKEWPRYAGLFGPAVGLGMMAAGVGKPDYSGLDAAMEIANGSPNLAKWQPIGNRLRYTPFDVWSAQNAMNAQARATDRALMNSGSQGSRAAGLLASGYNSQIASGNLLRQAQEYNDQMRRQTAEFNRGTDMYNSEQYAVNSRFNADALNRNRQFRAGLQAQTAAQKMANQADWYNSLYGNVSGIFKGLSDLGRENAETNWRNALAGVGVFGNISDDNLVKWGMAKYKKNSKR